MEDAIGERLRKRRKVDESVEVVSPPPSSRRSHRRGPVAEVVITPAHRPRPSTIVAQPSAPPSRRASSSTSFSPIEQSSSFSSGSHLAPPSTIASSRSVPDFSSNSLRLEVSLLRSRLKATEQLLQREQLRARQEIVTLQEQFAAERQAYMEYIERLQGGTRVD